MAKVLLVDTNFSSLPILNELKRLGHEVWLVGRDPQDTLAKTSKNYIQEDYAEPQALEDLARHDNFDFIIPGCNDRSYLSCSMLVEKWKHLLPGVDNLDATLTLLNKTSFRRFALKEGLTTPRIFEEKNLPQKKTVIVKPEDAYSGNGISIVKKSDRASINDAIQIAQSESDRQGYVIEELVEGQLYSHSAFLKNGRITHDVIVKEFCSAFPFSVDTSHISLDLSELTLNWLRQEIEHISFELSLNDGLIHTQFILNSERAYLIEITRRCPGDLYSQLIELSTNLPYVANYVAPHLGGRVSALHRTKKIKWILRHTLTLPQGGDLHHIQFNRPLVIEQLTPLSQAGSHLSPAPRGRIAILFARAQDNKELTSLAESAKNRSLFSLNP